MFKSILIVIALAIVGLLIFAATRPDDFRVQRSIHVDAPPEKIAPLLDNLHRFSDWSPYEKRDPAMKRSYSGPESGKGAAYAWEGNKEVGAGRMEILESSSSSVRMQLDFLKPFEAHNTAEFTMAPASGGTDVTWAMAGPSPFVSKLMGVFFNMDKMIGTDFETGLASLKTIAER